MAKKKKWIWPLVSLLLAVLSVSAVLSQLGEMPLKQFWETVREADSRWLTAAAVCGALFLILEGEAIRCILRGAGYPVRFASGLLYSASDIYFSAITPSATGGQPASALFMHRGGIPAGVVTAALLVNLLMYTLSIVLLGLAASVFDFRLIYGFSAVSKLLILIGFAVLLGLTAFFFILLGRGEKVFVFGAFFLNFLQRVSRIAVPMFTYMALGGIGRLAPRVFASQCFVTIGYNCVPVPGGMGVADYLMVDGFSDLMAFDDAIHLEVLSRSISFYICVAVSGVIVLIGSLIQRKRRRKQTQ